MPIAKSLIAALVQHKSIAPIGLNGNRIDYLDREYGLIQMSAPVDG